MKKNIYIQPCVNIVMIQTERLVADSFSKGQGTFDSENMKFVKGNTSPRDNDYNVWDDDWSK